MSLIMGGVNMVVYAIFATTSWFIIERAGRRKLFLLGTIGQMTAMTITFACLIPGTQGAAKGAAAGLFLYIASFGATWLPLPWVRPPLSLAYVMYISLTLTPAAVPCGNQPPAHPREGQRRLDHHELALQLCRRHDHADHDRPDRLGHLRLLCGHQRVLPAVHARPSIPVKTHPADEMQIPVLPRDAAALARGDRLHLRKGLRGGHLVRARGGTAAAAER